MAAVTKIMGTLSTNRKRLNNNLSAALAQGEQLSKQRDQLSQRLSQIQRRCSSLQHVYDGCNDPFARCKKKRKDLHDDTGACEATAMVGTMSMGTLKAPDTPTSEMLGALGLGLSSLARGQQGRNKKGERNAQA